MNSALLLPREVSALVHHVELNRAGWSDKTLNRLVLSTVWLAGENLDETQICRNMKDTFSLTVGKEKLASVIESLKAEDSLIEVSSGVYRIPDRARSELDREISEAEEAETKAHEYFHFLVAQSCPDLDASNVWNAFEHKFMVPMMRDIGANTYRLIAGEVQIVDGKHVDRILTEFGLEHRSALKAVVASFLDPKKKEVRDYITRTLHAYFCVEASGISKAVLDKLKTATAEPHRFRLFVDTNFLFSLLRLHENPSNAPASELNDLLATLKSNPQVDLYMTPRTISEAKSAIRVAKDRVSRVPTSSNFTEAALRAGMSGLSGRFFAERQQQNGLLTADDWFDPYLNDFVLLAQSAGVKLYNENFDEYSTRQDVVDDIHLVMDYEKKNFPEDRQKSYEKVAHDMILWHAVRDKRPAYVEAPTDAQEWILTVDFRLLRFDAFKLRQSESYVPLCLHPTSLIQLLQFWVPRTQKFEEAILGGLRLPFLFQEFDVKAERISIAIINRLGRFEGSHKIPEDTVINVVMNDGLRSRISEGRPEEEEIQLVRDVFVEDMRLQVETEKARTEKLTVVVEDKSAALAESREERNSKDAEIQELQKRLGQEVEKSRIIGKSLAHLTDEQDKLKSKVDKMEEEKLQPKVLLVYLGLLFIVVGLSVIAGWWAGPCSPLPEQQPCFWYGMCRVRSLHLCFCALVTRDAFKAT